MTSNASQGGDADVLRRLEQARYQALIDGDYTGFAALMTDDFVYNYAAGGTVEKRPLLEAMKGGAMQVAKVEMEDTQVRVHGDVAVVMGRLRSDVVQGGVAQLMRTTYLHVWLRGSEGWQLDASQHTYSGEAT